MNRGNGLNRGRMRDRQSRQHDEIAEKHDETQPGPDRSVDRPAVRTEWRTHVATDCKQLEDHVRGWTQRRNPDKKPEVSSVKCKGVVQQLAGGHRAQRFCHGAHSRAVSGTLYHGSALEERGSARPPKNRPMLTNGFTNRLLPRAKIRCSHTLTGYSF